MHIKHSWNAVPKNWVAIGPPPPGTTIDLYIVVKPRRENALVDALYEVSQPGHPRYRAYLTKEQVADLVAPRPQSLELVNSWLEHHGISYSSVSMTHGGNTLMLEAVPVTQANTLLGASYQLYRHVDSGETIVRTVGYSLPAPLHWHVLTVAPTTSFVPARVQRQTPRNRSDRAVNSTSGEPATMLSSRARIDSVTPSFLRWLYNTETYTPSNENENVLGIVGLLNQYPSPSDMAQFMYTYRPEAIEARFHVVKVNRGRYDPTHPHEEANIDTQYAGVMTFPTPNIFYSIGHGPSGASEDLWGFLEYILDEEDIPQTISLSYSGAERLVSEEHAVTVCRLFAMLGVRGTSVLVSSGNDGIGRGTCMRDDGTVRFDPTFPGTCPFVTVVGGTTEFYPEVAARFSGGGFSDYFRRPPYQAGAVSTFLQDLGNRYLGLYNDTGRGIPDIAAQALGLPIFLNGNERAIAGTSVAAPIVAGVISLLNDWLISIGHAPLGFLNPWLYGRGFQALNDITEGSNPGCGLDGFSAIAGWDPVTGLGTPHFRRMLEQIPEP
ncbi:subtilisin-like protein [Lactarius akahatsu]|uniref:tripeptidyl-peptidase II n=1 Tax=Lactarius akahatsu TaxID=416441 RepID=A0AAD4LKM3_9AGAM|nr:subtilisin-like protein [Lactarius akahatsu]